MAVGRSMRRWASGQDRNAPISRCSHTGLLTWTPTSVLGKHSSSFADKTPELLRNESSPKAKHLGWPN